MTRQKGRKKGPRKNPPDLAEAKRLVDELFVRQPVNDAELKRRLSPLDRRTARRVLVDRLESGDPEDGALFESAIRVLGPGAERERLISLVGRPGLPASLRMVVLNILDEPDRERAAPLLQALPQEEQSQLFWAPLMELMVTLQSDPDASVAVTDILCDVGDDEQEMVLYQIGHCRRETGTPAAVVYRDALSCDELGALHGLMIDAVVEEGGSEGIALLEELREEARSLGNGRHAHLQKALLRLRTHAIEPTHEATDAPTGAAYLSSCDGQGTYAILGCFDNPDGTATLSSLCIRAAGELRDALVMPRFDKLELAPFLDRYREGALCELVELSMGEAARMAGEAADRTRGMGLPLPVDVEPALALFGRTHPTTSDLEDPVGPEAPDVQQVRDLLKRREYQSWYFDWGDLESAGVPLPDDLEPAATPGWIDRAGRALDTAAVHQRIAAMAQHMTDWHVRRGEGEQAALCATFARSVREHDRADAALMQVMLERSWTKSLEEQDGDEEPEQHTLGDEMIRRDLRARFFADLADPRGRHLARLDFTEAALVALDDAVSAMPGHRRPRADQVVLMAHILAETFARLVLAPKSTRRGNWPARLADDLMEAAPLSPEEAGQLMGTVLSDLESFVEQVCSRCPVACLERPSAGCADAFYGQSHPAAADGDAD